jgi:hypothetical protein
MHYRYYPERRIGFAERLIENFCIAFEKLLFGYSTIEKFNKLMYEVEKDTYMREHNNTEPV